MAEKVKRINIEKEKMLFLLNELLDGEIKKTTTKEEILKKAPELYKKATDDKLLTMIPYEAYCVIEELVKNKESSEKELMDMIRQKSGSIEFILREMLLVIVRGGMDTREYTINYEILENLERLYTEENKVKAKRYARLEKLILGLVYSYGVVKIEFLVEQINRFIKEKITAKELNRINSTRLTISDKLILYKVKWESTWELNEYITCLNNLSEEEKIQEIIMEQKYRDYNYKVFKEHEILKREYTYWDNRTNKLYNYVKKFMASDIGPEVIFKFAIKRTEEGEFMLENLVNLCEFNNDIELEKFYQLFDEWYNNYPQYYLCGYTPNEFGRKFR